MCYTEHNTLFNSWKKNKTRIPPLKEVNTPCNIIIGFANLIKNHHLLLQIIWFFILEYYNFSFTLISDLYHKEKNKFICISKRAVI